MSHLSSQVPLSLVNLVRPPLCLSSTSPGCPVTPATTCRVQTSCSTCRGFTPCPLGFTATAPAGPRRSSTTRLHRGLGPLLWSSVHAVGHLYLAWLKTNMHPFVEYIRIADWSSSSFCHAQSRPGSRRRRRLPPNTLSQTWKWIKAASWFTVCYRICSFSPSVLYRWQFCSHWWHKCFCTVCLCNISILNKALTLKK